MEVLDQLVKLSQAVRVLGVHRDCHDHHGWAIVEPTAQVAALEVVLGVAVAKHFLWKTSNP